MHNENRRDGKREKEEREWEKEISRGVYVCRINDYISFIYCSIFVNNMIFCESFQFEMGKSSWFKMQINLGDYLPHLSVLLVGIWSNIFTANHVIQLWLLPHYFSPGKDAVSSLFCSICSTKKQFCKYIRSLNLNT